MLRLVVIGAGLIGREHCTLIREHPGADLAGLADISPETGPYAKEIRAPYFSDFERMLDETNPDGAIVAVPNKLHVTAGRACLSRGIPCLVEKPIADTVQSARELVELSERSEIPILVGHHRRHSPDVREARRLVEAGALGELVAVNGMWLADKPDDYFKVEWRRSPGGGPILINLIHEIDCLRFIVGEIASVRAFTSNAARGFDVEDTVSIALRFENGVLGSFLMSDAVASPYTWEVTSGQALYFPYQPGDCYFFAGRNGSLAVPSMDLWRHDGVDMAWQDPLLRQRIELDGSRTYRNQIEHFLAVVSGGEIPIVTARDAMMTLAATLAVETAAREDRTITVQEMLT